MTNPAANTLLIKKVEPDIVRICLNDITRRNALSLSMMQRLTEALNICAQDPAISVIILAANGPAFCAGHDLKELTKARENKDKGLAFFETTMKTCSNLMQLIIELPKPVIAEIDGVATAAGCQLVASCDLAYASSHARFATPGVNIGLFCSTPMVALSRNVSHKHAMEMLLTGDMVSAKRAKKIGLINKAVKDGTAGQAVLEAAKKIAAKSNHTISIGKEAFYRQAEMPLSKAYEYTSKVMVENMLHKSSNEGISAFLGKRAPQWDD